MNLSKLKLGIEESHEQVAEMPLGLDEKTALSLQLSKLKGRITRVGKELKLAGVFDNFWLWNIIFLNFALGSIFICLIYKYYSLLPQQIGINLDNEPKLDTLVDKSYLIYFALIHLLIPILTLFFVIRGQKKMNHLLVVSYLNYIALGIMEFIAFRGLILYFL